MTTFGTTVVLHNEPTRPLRGFPPGKVRIQRRPNDALRIFVKTECGIRQYLATEKDGYWEPLFVVSENERRINVDTTRVI